MTNWFMEQLEYERRTTDGRPTEKRRRLMNKARCTDFTDEQIERNPFLLLLHKYGSPASPNSGSNPPTHNI